MITLDRRRECKLVPYEKQYLTFEALEDATFSIPASTYYSLNGGITWTSLAASTATPTLHSGEKILWKKTASSINTTFTATGTFKVYGNIMSLIYGDNFVGKVTFTANSVFNNLFKGNTYVVDASNLILPATTLRTSCYANMFSGCSSLVHAPKELPSATQALYSCQSMFINCSNLTETPFMPSLTLGSYSYSNMFRHCTKLNYVKCLATQWESNSTWVWLDSVASSGTFVKNVNATWGRDGSGIPSSWNVINDMRDYLPAGYKQVEYIENTSNAYINTGVLASSDIQMTLDVYIPTTNASVNSYLIGGYPVVNQETPRVCLYRFSTNAIYFTYNTTSTSYTRATGNQRIKIEINKNTFKINSNFEQTVAEDTFTTSTYITLLGSSWIRSMNDSYSVYGKIYGATIGDVRNFVPCISPDNVVGLYDIIGHQFYSSPNGTPFVAGNVVK